MDTVLRIADAVLLVVVCGIPLSGLACTLLAIAFFSRME